MRKLLTIIAAMIICNAYGEKVVYMVDGAVYEATQCEDKNNITMPTQGIPQKTGFRFIGWKEGSVYDLLATNGMSCTPTGSSATTTWTATFSWGTVTGSSRCSSISGTASCWNDSTGATCTKNSSPSSGGKYCWCKLTDSDGLVDVSSLAWVFRFDYSSASDCASYCASYCGRGVRIYSGFRRAVFGVTQ